MKSIFFLFFFLPVSLFSQKNTIGLPTIINYSKQTYGAGLQNWDIAQDKNDIIYIANNEGLLSFDGETWNIYPLPNRTIVRSVTIGPYGKIYVGGQDELGYFLPNAVGKLTYHSLTNLIPKKDKSFGDVWDIVSFHNYLFFRCTNKIFKFSNLEAATYYSTSEWTYMGTANGHLYAHDKKAGLMSYENNSWKPLSIKSELPESSVVTGIFMINQDSSLITTLKSGLFSLSKNSISKVQTQNDDLFKSERIYTATMVDSNWIALGTNSSGAYIIDLKGNIIQSFSKEEGLQNNNVLSIFMDNQGNLWLGLDNGIDIINFNSAIKHINPSTQDGSGYTAIIHQNELYLGTTNGLYGVSLQQVKDLSFSKGVFSQVENSKGQVWSLADINNQLLMGHHEGAFVIKDNVAKAISNRPGFWNFDPLAETYPSKRIVAGYYKGIDFFNYANGSFSESGTVPDFDESSRFVAIDKNDNIWVSHPYHGVYKISKNAEDSYSISAYNDKKGLPSTLNNSIFKIKNQVVAATGKGIYEYNSRKDIFEPSTYYRKLLGDQSIRYLKEDPAGNIWFIHEKSLGVIDFSTNQPSVIYLPELTNKMLSGFEFIYPYDDNNIFLGAEKGFFLINYQKYKRSARELNVQVRSVRITGKKDSLIFGGYFEGVNDKQIQNDAAIPEIANKWKTIQFRFSSILFGYQTDLEYSFKLKGFDENWSEWKKRTEKEYTNLPSGDYTFQVKARNNLGRESAVATYSFKILPPWYNTMWAHIIYLLLLPVLIYGVYRIQKRALILQKEKHEDERKRLLYIHELELDKNEKELVALRNEKLEAEINFKNSELASSAMHLLKKGELLSKIKNELNHILKNLDDPKPAAEIKKILKELSLDDNMDEEWENFSSRFDRVHSDFVVALKEKHPNLSPNELKLCTYLRMNLSTKEIAQLMNISVRGVDVGRYRLRKKLEISSQTNLFDYMIGIQTKS